MFVDALAEFTMRMMVGEFLGASYPWYRWYWVIFQGRGWIELWEGISVETC